VGRRIAIGPRYFNLLGGMLVIPLLILTGIGPLIAWRRASLSNLRNQFVWPVANCLVVAALLAALIGSDLTLYALMVWSLAAFVTTSIVQEYVRAIRARVRKGGENALQAFGALLRKNQQRYGGYIVHLGIVFVMVGTAGSVLNKERLENMSPGDQIAFEGYEFEYLTADAIPEQHYGGAIARLALYRDGVPLGVMTPEKRMYWLEQQPASIPSIYSTALEDLYVILTNIEKDGSATFKIYRNPLVNWIWVGGCIFVLGSIAIMWPHRQAAARPDPG
jgi:cytochrome c-type biogenesis protein CcmF